MVATLLATASPGSVAQVEQDRAGAHDNEPLEEIVVVATRFESHLMKTPVAVTAVTQDALTQHGIINVGGIAEMVPNMQMGLSTTDSGVQASIRGVTSTNFTEIGDPSVSVHVDGFYSARPQGSLALMFDVDRVEALRGPQGTLFGRNSPGGTVNIITAKADTEASYGNVQLELGNYNRRLFQGVGNMAISDTLALRAAVMHHTRDGYIDQRVDQLDRHIPSQGIIADGIPDVDQRYAGEVDGSDAYYNADEWGARLSLRWQLADSLNWDLSYDHYRNRGAGAVQLKDCNMAAGTRFACTGDDWEAAINVNGNLNMDIGSIRSALSWEIDDNTSLYWRVGYQITDREQRTDGDAGLHLPDEMVDVSVPVVAWAEWGNWLHNSWSMWSPKMESKNLVSELQLSQEFDSFRYVAGAFYMDENSDSEASLDYEMHAPFGFPYFDYYDQPNRSVKSKALFAQGDFAIADRWTMTVGGRYTWDEKSDKDGRSYIGPWDGIAWTDEGMTGFYYNGLHIPVDGQIPHNGLNLTREMGPEAGPGYLADFGIVPSINDYEAKWNEFTWRLGVQYDVSEDTMFYGSVATGYKAGGFGDQVDRCGGGTCEDGSTQQYTNLEYDPEEVISYEFGYRGRLLDGRMNVGATLFFSDYTDMQFTGMHAIGRTDDPCTWAIGCELTQAWSTENIGQSEIYGLELEFNYSPWDNGHLAGYVSWLHTEIVDYRTYSEASWMCSSREEFGAVPCVDPYEGDEIELRGRRLYDVTGNQLPFSPEYSAMVSYSHDIPLSNGYSLQPWISVRWQDDMYFTPRNLDNAVIGDYQEAHTTLDASLRFSSPDDKRLLEFYGSNLTDEFIKNWMGNDQANFVQASFNPPRQYGLRARFNF